MADTKEYFVRMAVSTDVTLKAESVKQAMDLAEKRVYESDDPLLSHPWVAIDIIDVRFGNGDRIPQEDNDG